MKKIAILGAGESGTGAALLAQANGWEVFVSDAGSIAASYRAILNTHHITFEEKQHSCNKILSADVVVKSPGIPRNTPIIQTIQRAGLPIIDEIEFASRYTQAFLIGITGTNGKTTTTHLTYHLLKAAGLQVDMAGNVGSSFARKVLQQKKAYYVLELSSFQLEYMHTCKLDIACLLNITPDHLDRYQGQMASYIKAKSRILQNMTAQTHFIYNQTDVHIQDYIKQHTILPCQHPVPMPKHSHTIDTHEALFATTNPALQGPHNRLNTLIATKIAQLLHIETPKIQAGLDTFVGVPHRIEWVASFNEVDFYNDSKATNVAATYAALTCFTQPILWIAGGFDKGNDYNMLYPLVSARVKSIICLGRDNTKFRQAFQHVITPIYETSQVAKAVAIALSLAQPNDVVLLSPACASFDLFNNFEERGNLFKEAVKQAKNNTQQAS